MTHELLAKDDDCATCIEAHVKRHGLAYERKGLKFTVECSELALEPCKTFLAKEEDKPKKK